MPAQFTIPLQTVIPGQLITSALWNNEFENIDSNFVPSGMDDASANDGAFETDVDPYPASVISRPTSLEGELHRLRYQIRNITGEDKWQKDPDATIAALHTRVGAIESGIHAAGNVIPFFQAAAPTGWTKLTTHDDKALRVVSGAGGGNGGTTNFSAGVTLAHSHTVNSHTHSISSELDHTHSTPSHTHTLVNGSQGSIAGGTETNTPIHVDSAGGAMNATSWGGGGTHTLRQVSATTNSGEGGGTSGAAGSHNHGGNTGAATPGTDSKLTDTIFKYVDVIMCSKN